MKEPFSPFASMALPLRGVCAYCAAPGAVCRPRTLPRAPPYAQTGALFSTSSDSRASVSFISPTSANFATLSSRICGIPSRARVSVPRLSTPPVSLSSLVRLHGVSDKIPLFPSSSFATASTAVTEKSAEIVRALKPGDSVLAAGVPAHLRHPMRGSTTESFTDKVYRWLDVTGVLTRWNNRKEWVLDLIPMNRLGSSTVTEFERKQEMFVTLNAQILALIAIYLAYTGIQHVNVKPPNPAYEGFPGVDGRKKDFTLTNRLFFIEPKERCKECRWLDLECKKECFMRLKAEGYKLFINKGDPLTVPRTNLEPPHFH